MGERLKLNSVSGNVVSFDTDLEKKLGSLKIGIEPVQEGSGDPSPDNVRAISGWTGANVVTAGINIWDEEWEIGRYVNGVKDTISTQIRCVNRIPIKPNTQYYVYIGTSGVSLTIQFLSSDGAYLSQAYRSNAAFTSPANARYMVFHANTTYGTTYKHDISINYPATNNNYHSYVGATYPITLPSAAGTVYGGELDWVKGILSVNWIKINASDLTWSHSSSYPDGVFQARLPYPRSTNEINVLSDVYKGVSHGYVVANMPNQTIKGNQNSVYNYNIYIRDDRYTATEDFNNNLNANIIYELETPRVYTLIPTEISTLLGANTLYADCGPIQEASYFSRDYVPVTSDTGLITITDGVEAPIDSLKIHFEPVQEGSGDPSPENVRPISGWSGVEVMRTGKNLFDLSWMLLPTGTFVDGVLTDTMSNLGIAFNTTNIPHTEYYQRLFISVTAKRDAGGSDSRGLTFVVVYDDGSTSNSIYFTKNTDYVTRTAVTANNKKVVGIRISYGSAPNAIWNIKDVMIVADTTPTAYEPYAGQTYPITFPSEAGTVYGGYVDVAKGELVVDRGIVDLSALTWTYNTEYRFFQSSAFDTTENHPQNVIPDILVDIYKPVANGGLVTLGDLPDMSVTMRNTYKALTVKDSRFTDGVSYKAAIAGTKCIYPLSEPLTYSLTPTQLSTIKGLNNIYSDANGAIEMSYYSPVKENILSARRRSFAWDYKTYIASHPAVLQKLCSTGKASNYFNIGDEIIIPWTDNGGNDPIEYQYPFVVTHFGDVYDENGDLHENGMWLMAKYATPSNIVFDAAESTTVDLTQEPNALQGWYYWGVDGSNYTALELNTGDAIPTTHASVVKCGVNNAGVLRYGYNRWKDSAYRQWLNSDAAKNEGWWTEQHMGDHPPAAAQLNLPGWLDGFTDEWKAIFKPVKVDTACNTVTDGGVTDTTYDTFFLPSLEQMYGAPQAAGVEGDYWEYWKEETGLDTPTNGSSSNTNEARKIPSIANPTGSAVNCYLRSAIRGNASGMWYVHAAGFLAGNYATTSYRALPACVIY